MLIMISHKLHQISHSIVPLFLMLLTLTYQLYQSLQKTSAIKRSLKENVVKYISVAHARSGCDSTSSLFRKGKTHAFKVLDNDKDLPCLDVFKANNSKKEQIASSGEKFLLLMYNAHKTCQSLDNMRFLIYKKQVNKNKLISASGLELCALPPTSDSAKYQSYRSYHQIQKWLDNDNDPTSWGYTRNNYLIPVVKDKAAAPDKILKLLSCGCKKGYSDRTCVCIKANLLCSILCSGCNGRDRTNVEYVIESEESD